MSPARSPALALLAAALWAAAAGAGMARAQEAEPPLNPHTREACLRCHKGTGTSLGPDRTTIFHSREEPHAAVAGACRSCHKDGKEDFWLLILPSGPGKAPPPVAERKPQAPLGAPAAGGLGEGEGFENSHDAMDCKGCHDKPAEELKKGVSTPPRFTAEGADAYCRTCHSGVDRSHFPRGNLPKATCLNCHRAHGRTLFFPALREDFPQFIAEATQINPHGGKIFCLACHPDTPQEGQPVDFRYQSAARLCQRCHAGVEHHPLGVKSSPDTWKMDFTKFPLEEDAVTCLTCHKPPECRNLLGRENPRFLRDGPYNSVEEFCRRCHEEKKFSSLNPHDQIDESGLVNQKKCLYCHVSVPGAGARADELQYTDTLQALCVSCHPVAPHPGVDHLVPMPPDMERSMHAFEEKRMVVLPLDGGRVTCVTCHNPHERGLLKGAAGIGADEEHRVRLATFNEVCTPCHGRK